MHSTFRELVHRLLATLDGSTSDPIMFMGRTGKCLHQLGQLEQISMQTSSFPKLPANVVSDLSTDQYYAYRICGAIINEVVDDLLYLEVEPIVHLRLLTL